MALHSTKYLHSPHSILCLFLGSCPSECYMLILFPFLPPDDNNQLLRPETWGDHLPLHPLSLQDPKYLPNVKHLKISLLTYMYTGTAQFRPQL